MAKNPLYWTSVKNARILIEKGEFFPPEQTAPVAGGETEFDRVAARILEDVYFGSDKGVQQQWFTSEDDAFNQAAKAAGYTDPAKLTDAGKRAVREKFNIYAQAGRWTYASRAAAAGKYDTDIIGEGEERALVLTQGGRHVATSILGAKLEPYKKGDLTITVEPIPDSTEEFVVVQDKQGNIIDRHRRSTLDEATGETTFAAAWARGLSEGIPEHRLDVKTSVTTEGKTSYWPSIKAGGAAEADISGKIDSTHIPLGEGQGSLLLYKVGNQVGSVRIPPKPGVTIQNTFRTPGGGVRAVFSDGSEKVYGEEDFVLGTPTQRVGPNGQMDWYIETAPGQYSQIPETFKPDVVRIGDREFTQDVSGRLTPLAREFDPGITQIGGRTIMQQPSGQISELQRQFEPGVITDKDSGLQLLQQPSGAVSQTRAANINEIIAQALIDGNFDKALAFQDFANRPSAKEAFDAALSFARSPADQQLVSSIARGETPVAPPPPGVVQRIGPQPDFLVQAYNEFQQRLRGGRPPTPEEQEQYSARYRAGETPVSDEFKLKLKTQEDANARAMEKNEQAMAAMEQRRETDQRNFDLQLQKQNQDFEVKLAQVTGNFQRVGQERTATGTKRVDDAYAAAGGDPTVAANKAAVDAMSTGDNTKLSATELIEKGLAAKEEVFKNQFSDLNRALSKGAAGIGPWAGLVSADELRQWALTASKNARTSSSPYQQTLYESFFGLADARWESSGEADKQRQAKRMAETAGTSVLSEDVGGFKKGDVVTDAQLEAIRQGQQLGIEKDIKAQARASQAAIRASDRARRSSAGAWDYVPPSQAEARAESFGRFSEEAETSEDVFAEIMEGYAPGAGFSETSAGEAFAESISQGPAASTGAPGEESLESVLEAGAGWADVTGPGYDPTEMFARGGMTSGKRLEIVGEEGPELVDLPPGTFVLPIKGLSQRQVRQAKSRGVPGYQSGGIVFQDLPLGLRQQQAGRAITPPRGYLSRAAGLTLPSAQAFQNITPESREVFFDVAKQAGIPQGAFAQELRTAFPGGQRLPVSRNYPLRFRGVR